MSGVDTSQRGRGVSPRNGSSRNPFRLVLRRLEFAGISTRRPRNQFSHSDRLEVLDAAQPSRNSKKA